MEVVRLYTQGYWSASKIAKYYGVRHGAVFTILRRAGVESRGKEVLHGERLSEVVDLYISGCSAQQTAKRLGVCRHAVVGALKREGVALRSRSESVVLAVSHRRVPAEAKRSYQQKYHKKYSEENREKLNEYKRRRRRKQHKRLLDQEREYRLRNHDRVLARKRAWQQANRDKVEKSKAKRRALQSAAVELIVDEDWRTKVAELGSCCIYCHKILDFDSPDKFLRPTKDHLVALAVGGDHTLENIVPACLSCNCSKGDRAAPF